jgi:hypothetical protein
MDCLPKLSSPTVANRPINWQAREMVLKNAVIFVAIGITRVACGLVCLSCYSNGPSTPAPEYRENGVDLRKFLVARLVTRSFVQSIIKTPASLPRSVNEFCN